MDTENQLAVVAEVLTDWLSEEGISEQEVNEEQATVLHMLLGTAGYSIVANAALTTLALDAAPLSEKEAARDLCYALRDAGLVKSTGLADSQARNLILAAFARLRTAGATAPLPADIQDFLGELPQIIETGKEIDNDLKEARAGKDAGLKDMAYMRHFNHASYHYPRLVAVVQQLAAALPSPVSSSVGGSQQEALQSALESATETNRVLAERLMKAAKVLEGYEKFEGNIIECDAAWNTRSGHPWHTEELYDEWMELHAQRNQVLHPREYPAPPTTVQE